MLSRRADSNLWAVLLSAAALLPLACDRGSEPIGPAPTVTDMVTNSTDGNHDLDPGEATLRCSDGDVNQEDGLTRVEVFEFGNFALYVPARVATTRGLMLALGGPDTRGFVTGKPLGAPIPAVEASLQTLGQEFRMMASTCGLAILGVRSAMANGPASDQLLFDAVQTAAALSAHPELPTAPVLVYGISGGAPQASGFVARNPARVAGLFLKVPAGVSSLTNGDALGVPTYVVQAELDAFVNNAAVTATFEGNRGAGALWARAMERGVPHHSLTPLQRQVTINWMSTILSLRLPVRLSHPLREIAEARGWLGNLTTGDAVRWAAYRGDRTLASWLPSKSTANEWERLVAPIAMPAVRQVSTIP